MMETLQDFHFLRPLWFYGLIPAMLLFIILFIRKGRASNWQNAIAPDLLPYLLRDTGKKTSRGPLSLILIAWMITIIALAGPVWKKVPQPIHEREDALVILFDLSLSMYAEDVKPNRLIRARRKLLDLLKRRDEGVTGLIVYAGDAHRVSPLTDDAQTIASMIPAITPEIMPVKGSRLAPAIKQSMQLFRDAGVESGQLLIITDEIRDPAAARAAIDPHASNFPLSVLSVGTEEGAPVPQQAFDPRAGYLKDRYGALVIAKVDQNHLRSFAGLSGGRYASMRLTDEDLDYLLADDRLMENETYRQLERDFDIWFEEGPWLLLLLLPLAMLAFRRGWVWCILIVMTPFDEAGASLWDDLWKSRDQQGQEAMKEGRLADAAGLFEDSEWKASAYYRGEDYAAASEIFSTLKSGDGLYNLGNTLAKQGEYEDAIKAYEESLSLDPENEDAAFNKKLIEDLLQQQQSNQQNQSDDNQKEQDGQEKQDSQQNDSTQENDQNQQSGDQQQQQQNSGLEEQEGQEEREGQEEQDTQQQQEGEPPDQQKQMDTEDQQPTGQDAPAAAETEEQQALQQWLRRIPDDPGGLLRKKFRMQHQQRQKQGNRDYEDPDAKW